MKMPLEIKQQLTNTPWCTSVSYIDIQYIYRHNIQHTVIYECTSTRIYKGFGDPHRRKSRKSWEKDSNKSVAHPHKVSELSVRKKVEKYLDASRLEEPTLQMSLKEAKSVAWIIRKDLNIYYSFVRSFERAIGMIWWKGNKWNLSNSGISPYP